MKNNVSKFINTVKRLTIPHYNTTSLTLATICEDKLS